MLQNISEFEKVFGFSPTEENEDELLQALTILRDSPVGEMLSKFALDTSMAASPLCVIFAAYKALEQYKKIDEGFIIVGNFGDYTCDQAFRNEKNELLVYNTLEEAQHANTEECYYGIITYLGK